MTRIRRSLCFAALATLGVLVPAGIARAIQTPTTGQPGAPALTCGSPGATSTPSGSASAGGSPFNSSGTAGTVYAGNPWYRLVGSCQQHRGGVPIRRRLLAGHATLNLG
jgi:hypothetical protein